MFLYFDKKKTKKILNDRLRSRVILHGIKQDILRTHFDENNKTVKNNEYGYNCARYFW